MANRFNTLLVVLSVPTLISAAASFYWSRKRKLKQQDITASTESSESEPEEVEAESTTTSTAGSVSSVPEPDGVSSGTGVTDSTGNLSAHPSAQVTNITTTATDHPVDRHHQTATDVDHISNSSSIDSNSIVIREVEVGETEDEEVIDSTSSTPAPTVAVVVEAEAAAAEQNNNPCSRQLEVCSHHPAPIDDPCERQHETITKITTTTSWTTDNKEQDVGSGSRMQIKDETDLSTSPSQDNSCPVDPGPNSAVSNNNNTAKNGNPASASSPAGEVDLSSDVEKNLVIKSEKSVKKNKKHQQQQEVTQQPVVATSGTTTCESVAKKNSASPSVTAKKEKSRRSSQDDKRKNLNPSPASDSNNSTTSTHPATPSPDPSSTQVPESRGRKTHESGDSNISVDSGADVMSPASVTGDQKSSDRSVDSPGLYKSDVSQGSPYNCGSDSHSEGSSDSGKGGSDIQGTSYSPLQQFMPCSNQRIVSSVIYQFEIPSDLVGRLIGKSGTTIKQISYTSKARIIVNEYPVEKCEHIKVCTIEGDRSTIANALKLIRNLFPLEQFPELTLSQINAMPIATPQLYLMDGYPNDVIMSSLVSAGHFFLQQPTHISYQSLVVLNHMMNVTYEGQDTAPAVSNPSIGIIVAATVPALSGWYRALIVDISEDEAFCDVKYVDYGGCARLATSGLRQIRMDFMNLPFQACECYLADIVPTEGESWSAGANECFEKLAQGCIMKAIVRGMTEDGCTLVKLYKQQGMSNICINDELVLRGFARYVQPPIASSNE